MPEWYQKNKLDGVTRHFIGLQQFRTRRACRDWIEQEYGYIRTRPDLRREPHCWRVPRAVKVKVIHA
jgi:hypothetical protein